VRNQSYGNVEHIVVDGGSRDETLSVLAGYEGTYRLRWASEPDTGMYDAVNKGLKLASGSVVAYLNSDDLYLPWTVEAAVDGLDGADLVFGDLVLLLGDDSTKLATELRFYPDFDMAYYLYVGSVAQPTAFWQRDLIARIGYFDESYRLIADCDYWLRAASAGSRIRHLDEVLAIQVDHPETLRARNEAMLADEFSRLKDSYGATVARSWWHALLPAPLKLMWRRDLVRFRREMKKREPDRWGRFIGFLRAEGIEVDDLGLLLFLLPKVMRPSAREWIDGGAMLRSLSSRRSSGE
jgi:glycosyltransferase involved in cell wall biosynthesis